MNEHVKSEYLHSEITKKIIGVAIEVNKCLRFGFQEAIYHRALLIEFRLQNLQVDDEKELPIIYKGEKIGARRVDFLIDDKVLVEIKSVAQLDNNHLAQAINYLELFNLDVCLVINFGAGKLEYKRLVHPKYFKHNKTTDNMIYTDKF